MIGLVVFAIGALIAWKALGQYHIKITSASGEATALSSKDNDYIIRIIQALNEAIIGRG